MRSAIAVFFALAIISASAGQYFLNLTGINGEVDVTGFKNQIEITSIQFGLSRSNTIGSGSGGGSGQASFSDVTLTKPLDRSSPLLMLNCANGAHIPTAVFTAVETVSGTNHTYYQIELSDVVITSVSSSGGAGERPWESFSLNFKTILWKYYTQTNPTPIVAGWNRQSNTVLP